jgi:hypothetical protein
MKIPAKAIKPMLAIAALLIILLLKAGFIFLMLAFLPAIVAYYIDHDESRPIFKIVFTWNLAATLPTLIPLFKAGVEMHPRGIIELMANPAVWLFVYGGAAVGWGVIFLCRLVAKLIVAVTYEYQLKHMETLQKRLLDEWGQHIKDSAP